MAPILINRAPWNALIDDPGNNLEGTPWTKAQIKGVLLDPIDVALADVDDGTTKDAAQDALIAANAAAVAANSTNKLGATVVLQNPTGTQNNYVLPGRTKDTYWQWSGTADLNLTGIGGAQAGDRLTIKNVAAGFKITLPHLAAGSSAGFQFYNAAISAPTPIANNGWATYVNTGSAWILVDHEQGAPITAPFNAANFSAAGGPLWAVAAGNVRTLTYYLKGNELLINFYITTSALSGAPGVSIFLLNGAYGGFTTASDSLIGVMCNAATGGNVMSFMQSGPNATYTTQIAIYRSTAIDAWPAGSPVNVYGQIWLNVS